MMGLVLFASCSRDNESLPHPVLAQAACIPQTGNPSGHSYDMDSIVSANANGKYCGLLPISANNYWIYEDSVFNDGQFQHVQYDTLRFVEADRTLTDGLLWWHCNISIGLPDKMYVNDSAFFKLEERLFTPDIVDAKKDYSLFEGDSLRYLGSFEDAAAQGRSLRMTDAVTVPAGKFEDCLYFEKNARNYRRDQLIFRPGIGVLRYVREQAPMGTRVTRLQQISTLIKFHFE
jgi:hypothetical protein